MDRDGLRAPPLTATQKLSVVFHKPLPTDEEVRPSPLSAPPGKTPHQLLRAD